MATKRMKRAEIERVDLFYDVHTSLHHDPAWQWRDLIEAHVGRPVPDKTADAARRRAIARAAARRPSTIEERVEKLERAVAILVDNSGRMR